MRRSQTLKRHEASCVTMPCVKRRPPLCFVAGGGAAWFGLVLIASDDVSGRIPRKQLAKSRICQGPLVVVAADQSGRGKIKRWGPGVIEHRAPEPAAREPCRTLQMRRADVWGVRDIGLPLDQLAMAIEGILDALDPPFCAQVCRTPATSSRCNQKAQLCNSTIGCCRPWNFASIAPDLARR